MGVNVVQPEGEVLGDLFSFFTMGNAIGSPSVNFSKFKRHYNGPMLTISFQFVNVQKAHCLTPSRISCRNCCAARSTCRLHVGYYVLVWGFASDVMLGLGLGLGTQLLVNNTGVRIQEFLK